MFDRVVRAVDADPDHNRYRRAQLALPRSDRRGHDVGVEDFLLERAELYCSHSRFAQVVAIRRALALFTGWLGTVAARGARTTLVISTGIYLHFAAWVAACAARSAEQLGLPEDETRPCAVLEIWGRPEDDPTPHHALERLTARKPRAPSGLALREARAA
jgi:hypothetical protein